MSLETTTVELKSIGLVLMLSQSNWLMSRKRERLERQAEEFRKKMLARVEAGEVSIDDIDEDELLMRQMFYPVMAACVVSDNCPTIEQCISDISEEDLETWYNRAKELNPGWFAVLDKIAELANQQEEELADPALKKGMTQSEMTPDEKMPEKSLTG